MNVTVDVNRSVLCEQNPQLCSDRPLWVESSPFMAVEAGGASKLSGINAAQAMAFFFDRRLHSKPT